MNTKKHTQKHDPKGKVYLKLDENVQGHAVMSPCERYRTRLERRWGKGDAILFVGLNPSVADATHSDPTCAREEAFAKRWGFDAYLKGNVMDWRATHPKDIPQDPKIACSGDNLSALENMAKEAKIIVMACGVIKPAFISIFDNILDILVSTKKPIICLKKTKDGWPGHPLYIAKTQTPQPYFENETLPDWFEHVIKNPKST